VAPATGDAESVSVDPAQTGLLLEVVGAAGVVLTVTATVPARLVQPPTVTVTEYVPLAAAVTAAIVGFCNEDEKLFGPVHEYVAPATAGAESVSVFPVHTGELLVAVGVAGIGLTATVVVATELVQPFAIAVTE
jgi:hypothetical protein